MTNIRIGQGYDVHRFGEGDHIMLGNVTIPYNKGFVAHSDGDVLIHAICDALLGALALGDIGHHFPDTDDIYSGISSAILLEKVYNLISHKGYQLGNLDCVVIAQAPRLAPYILQIRERLAELTHTSVGNISVKATTTEKLGFEGRKEGVAVMASVLLELTS